MTFGGAAMVLFYIRTKRMSTSETTRLTNGSGLRRRPTAVTETTDGVVILHDQPSSPIVTKAIGGLAGRAATAIVRPVLDGHRLVSLS